MMEPQAISLLELNRRVSSVLASATDINNVWVVAETSDLRCSGPHCYLELIDKNPDTGSPVARARATIWGARYVYINNVFLRATGSPLSSGIKVMVKASVSFHPVYGLSLNITDVNPEYTLGDLLRRRREMIARLTAEGIIDMNRSIAWPAVASNIAVISAAGAAGYGDFINQLYTNRYCLRFTTRLFPAVLQGENTAPSIISALQQVIDCGESFDCVVIIRGGGATGDLASFDNYELAANIAMFPLPVIIGIGHERDVTLLDYVANMRVKTPTAAAEWLIAHGAKALERLGTIGNNILEAVSARLNREHRRLSTVTGQLPLLAQGVITRNAMLVGPKTEQQMIYDIGLRLKHRAERLDALQQMIEDLSPEATLRRGFSITRVDGHAITHPGQAAPGSTIITTLAQGELISIIPEKTGKQSQ